MARTGRNGGGPLRIAIFLPSLEVGGAERIPRGTPLVLVANHVNGLIDPLNNGRRLREANGPILKACGPAERG